MKRLILEDLLIAARTIWGEGRSEPYEGQKAIAHVMINRWLSDQGQWRRDDTLASTCLRHVQFSSWNQSDVNFDKMMRTDFGDFSLIKSLNALLEAIIETQNSSDPTHNATHYHTKDILPHWAVEKIPVYEIGNHVFYNNVD